MGQAFWEASKLETIGGKTSMKKMRDAVGVTHLVLLALLPAKLLEKVRRSRSFLALLNFNQKIL
jgi:hypothetical protein